MPRDPARKVLGLPDKEKCSHKWVKMDKDDRFRKKGKFEVKRVQEICNNCGEERVRKVKRRF